MTVYVVDECSSALAKDVVKSELNILKNGSHWKKAYFYLWDEVRISTCSDCYYDSFNGNFMTCSCDQPVGFEQYENIRRMSEEIRTFAPDARVLTTYYCGEYIYMFSD